MVPAPASGHRTKICTYHRVCAPICCTYPGSRLHRKSQSAKMRTGGPSRGPRVSLIAQVAAVTRRVEGDNARGTPDDPASTGTGTNRTIHQRSWTHKGKPKPLRNTPRHQRKPMRSKPAESGAPATCTLCENRAWRSSHARGNPKPVQTVQKHKPQPRRRTPLAKRKTRIRKLASVTEWLEPDLNRRHPHFQCGALPTELSSRKPVTGFSPPWRGV